MSVKSCWVTGAYGFIGRRVAKELSSHNCKVYGLGHGGWPQSEWRQWGLDFCVNGDLNASNLNFLKEKFSTPEEIYHLAGGSSVSAAFQNPQEDFNRNVAATSKLLEWVRQESPATKVIVSSSAAVYGNGHSHKIKETQLPAPYSVYGHNKAMTEDLCSIYAANYGLKIVIARIFSVYGAGLKRQLLWDICTKLTAKPTVLQLSGSGDESRDWMHVDDTVLALKNAIHIASDEVPVINIGTGKGISVRKVAKLIIDNWEPGSHVKQCRIEFDGTIRAGDPFSLIADTSKLSSLGVDLERELITGIREFITWYKEISAI